MDIVSLSTKLAKVRGLLKPMYKSKSGYNGRYQYTPLDAMLVKINPILSEVGVSIVISQEGIQEVSNKVYYIFKAQINDDHDEYIANYYIPESVVNTKSENSSNPIMDYGATVTYGQRYIYQCLLGIPMDSDDPDAKITEVKNITEFDDVWNLVTKEIPNPEKRYDTVKAYLAGTLEYKEIVEVLK